MRTSVSNTQYMNILGAVSHKVSLLPHLNFLESNRDEKWVLVDFILGLLNVSVPTPYGRSVKW